MKEWFFIIFASIVFLGGIFGIGFLVGRNSIVCEEQEFEYQPPVEKIVFDTLYIKRDSIVYRTKYLTKIQHDTIEKIHILSADSTLDLFYQLVSEE